MPDYRRMMDPGPNDPITPELLRQWNPGAYPGERGLDPAYSDRYLLDERSQDTLGQLAQALQSASGRTEAIDEGLGRLQSLQEEQKGNLQPLWNQEQSGPGFMDQLKSGLGSVGDAISGGLGALGGATSRGLDAITPSQGTIDNLAMRLQNAHAIGTGRAPLWMQQQEHQANMSQMQELMQMRRAQASHQLRQEQEAKRSHDLQLLEKVMSNPRGHAMLEQLGSDPNFSLNQQAKMLHKGMKESDMGSFSAYKEFIPEEVQQKFMSGQLPAHELGAWLDEARTAAKESAKINAKNAVLTRAMNKANDQRTPYEQQLVEEHQAKLEVEKLKPTKMQSEIDENKAQAEKYRKEIEQGKPDRSEINRVSLAITGKSFDELPPGSPEMKRVIEEHATRYAQARQLVQQATPASVKERSNVIDRKAFLQAGSLNRPPAGTSIAQLNKGDYIELSDKQQEEAQKIEQAKENLTSMMDLVMPHIKAKTVMEAGKQWAELQAGGRSGLNSDIATYMSGIEAFSSVFSRVFGGEVGVLTDRDINRWKETLPTLGDMKATAEKKRDLFFKLYDVAVQKYRKKVAGEDTKGIDKQIEGLLSQSDKLKNQPTVTKQGNSSKSQTGPYSDPDKEKRYQEWKRSQGK